MTNVLDHSKPYQKYFEEITRIPHGSFNEKPLSDYLIDWAKKHGLRCLQDDMWNVVIYKPASAGYEDREPLILQGHMDMVCVKEAESAHDFLKDPLELYVEDGWLRAKGTTLGADDGVGCAYMLAILEDRSLRHPPLECIFTVQEEVGCNGAANLKSDYFKASRMLGLDDVGGGTTYVSTAGGQAVEFSRKVIWEAYSGSAYEWKIWGLKGGHSGVDIDKERGSAIKLAAKMFSPLIQEEKDFRIVSVNFGSAGNSIPAEGSLIFTINMEEAELRRHIEACQEIFFHQLEGAEDDFKCSFNAVQGRQIMSRQDSIDIISFLRLIPDGLRHRAPHRGDVPIASCNLGTVKLEKDVVVMTGTIRSPISSYIDQMEEEQLMLCGLFGFVRRIVGQVIGFDYIKNSTMRETLDRCFFEVTGRHIEEIYVHGGLECGIIANLKSNMDIATIGPLAPGEHTVEEKLNLQSFDEIYETVVKMLAAL